MANNATYTLETFTAIYWSVSGSCLLIVFLACAFLQMYVYRKAGSQVHPSALSREKTMAIKTTVNIDEDQDAFVWLVNLLVEIERPLLLDIIKWSSVGVLCAGLLQVFHLSFALIPLLLYDVGQFIHVCRLFRKKDTDRHPVFLDVKQVHLSYTLFAGFPVGSTAKIIGVLWLDGKWEDWGYLDFGFAILFAPQTLFMCIFALVMFLACCCECCRQSDNEPKFYTKRQLCLLFIFLIPLWLFGGALMISSSTHDIYGTIRRASAAIYDPIASAIGMTLPMAIGFAFVFGAYIIYTLALFLYVSNSGRLLKVVPEFADFLCFGGSMVTLYYFIDNPDIVSLSDTKLYAMVPLFISCFVGLLYDVLRIVSVAKNRRDRLAKWKRERDASTKVTQMEVKVPSSWRHTEDEFQTQRGQEGHYEKETLIGGLRSIKDDIERVMRETWITEYMKIRGRDNQGLTHTGFKVTKVERVMNPYLWSQYFVKVQDITRKYANNQFERQDWMRPCTSTVHCNTLFETLKGLNEFYFFHGTSSGIAETICADGLDFRIGKDKDRVLFGKGIYLAENSSKSDQYCKLADGSRGMQGLKMFLVRAVLGRPYLTKKEGGFSRPPCTAKGCMSDTCPQHTSHFDSIIGDIRPIVLYREFMLYDKPMCYPEYLITYDRIE